MSDLVCPKAVPPSKRHRWVEKERRTVCSRCGREKAA